MVTMLGVGTGLSLEWATSLREKPGLGAAQNWEVPRLGHGMGACEILPVQKADSVRNKTKEFFRQNSSNTEPVC